MPESEEEKVIQELEDYRDRLLENAASWRQLAEKVDEAIDGLNQFTISGFLKERGKEFLEEISKRVLDKYDASTEEEKKNFNVEKETFKAMEDFLREKANEIGDIFRIFKK